MRLPSLRALRSRLTDSFRVYKYTESTIGGGSGFVKNITFKDLGDRVKESYNFSPTFCFFVSNYIATALRRNYWKDSLDLADIDVHNAIEHDASLTRK